MPPKTQANTDSNLEPSFTESIQTLDTILDRFKSGSLTLEESLTLFEHGITHLKVCQSKLTQARGRVEELVQTMQEGGETVTRPFECGDDE
jgi:exodeoxyribonuclease VII small subunit